ncbi:activating transcription factor 7-interacting protein 1 isoform X3 [Silurus asotus]|uniref:Activating transcription factor 7-interacting protein 1 isoform X3 n=1 Tax=Silurus asotus TaxID=30991 RepID=A0AAD5FJT1_SILAS|nr:activating transcription factor 7-interacting protein 1 isoform X3 [Silurus asotus]
MEVAVPEEPQKKIFRARKTMKMSDRQQLEVLHNTLVTANPNSSSQPQTPLVNGTHGEDGLKGKEKDKESGTKSPVSPLSRSSPIPSLSRSPSPSVRDAQNSSPSLKKCSEKGKVEDKKGEQDRKDDEKAEEVKADKLEIKSAHPGSPSGSDKKIEHKKSTTVQVLNGELPVDSDSTSLDNGSAEEKSSKSIFSSSPSGSPAASLECDPEVKEGFLCLSEEDEGQGEQDEAKDKNEEKMDVDPEKEENKEGERGCNVADGTGACTTGKKRSLSPVEGKAGEPKEERDGKRARVEGVQLEAQLELKITANAGSRLKLEKVVQQLVEERLRMLQMTVFDCNLQELKDRMEKIDAATKQQKTVQHTLQSKIARLTKKFGAANQASENFKKVQEAAAKPTPTPTTVQTMQRNVRTTLDPKPSTLSAGSSSTATPTQPKPHSTPSTPTSSAVATPAPILQLIATTTNSTPSSSSSSLSGQASTLLLQQRPNTGAMTTSTVTSAGQPMSIQPLLIQLPLAMANGQGGTLAGGVGLIPVSSLGTVTSLSKAKTTTATTFILQKTSGSVVTTSSAPSSLISSATSAVTQMPPSRPIYQGGTGTANSPNAGISVTTARAPAQCATVVGMATASSSPASTGPAATGSAAAAAAGPPSASETASKTDNQAIHSAPAKSSAQPRPKGSVIDLTEDDDDVQVTGVQKATAPTIPTNTQRPPGPPPSLVSSTSVAGRSTVQHRPTVDSPSKTRTSSSSTASLPPLPLAPAPPARLPPEAAHTSPPQQPQLKLARVQSQNGIVLSWCVSETERNCAPVDSYHLYAYHQDQQSASAGSSTQSPSHSLWKKIGEVKALPLPMACTLTQFVSGSTYYFAVRAKDVYGRFGPFCDPQCTDVINPQS